MQILDVYSPNLVVPSLTKDPSKSKVILRDFGEPPFFVRLPCRMLRQHSSHVTPSYSEYANEHRINSIHGSSITKPFDLTLIHDDLADEIETIDAINEELQHCDFGFRARGRKRNRE